jgi:Mechanosensitive ion channel, conserved TM helix
VHRTTLAVDVGASFQQTLNTFFAFLPNVLGFLLILLIGYVVAKIVKTLVSKVLEKLGIDRRLQESNASRYTDAVSPGASPSNAIATVIVWLVFAFFFFTAIGALKIPALTTFMNSVLSYLPNVIAAILIFIVAALIAGAVAAAITRVMGETPTGKVAAAVLPALVMVIALFMILQQLQIAPQIVQIAFAATMGALALGLALAFGLGGRPIAQKMLEDAYRAGQEHKEQIKQDIQAGRQRAQRDMSAAQTQPQYQGPPYGQYQGPPQGQYQGPAQGQYQGPPQTPGRYPPAPNQGYGPPPASGASVPPYGQQQYPPR